MNHVLKENLNRFCTVYLDDILIYSHMADQYTTHLCWVLQQLWQHLLKAKQSKCTFRQQELEYLGHIVSAEGIKADQQKCDAINA